ncbi:MAG: tRNA (guanosine(37)-N1)-methyltransferase TrmD [Chloroflexi bacterium]|nr:MAG: tRNA (guanosine(37)-N1)-methyltransferase TrmD [Chloroflexota bacterium]
MRIDILTLFPGMFRGPFSESIIKRAVDAGIVSIHMHDIRQWAKGRHKVADDYVYGGGPGMVMKPEPAFEATEAVLAMAPEQGPVILLTPIGRRFEHETAVELAGKERLVLLCGHYEGFDARVHEALATDEISIGDFVLSGGEIPAMAVVDAVVRQIPGALGSAQSAQEDSFAHGLLEAPHYTRPPEYRGLVVPDVLLSGNHQKVAKWRRRRNLLLTTQRRPDLLSSAELTEEEKAWLAE